LERNEVDWLSLAAALAGARQGGGAFAVRVAQPPAYCGERARDGVDARDGAPALVRLALKMIDLRIALPIRLARLLRPPTLATAHFGGESRRFLAQPGRLRLGMPSEPLEGYLLLVLHVHVDVLAAAPRGHKSGAPRMAVRRLGALAVVGGKARAAHEAAELARVDGPVLVLVERQPDGAYLLVREMRSRHVQMRSQRALKLRKGDVACAGIVNLLEEMVPDEGGAQSSSEAIR
jgi:hypothetical protein